MLSSKDILAHIKANITGEFYPLRFPVNSKDACTIINITSGAEILGDVTRIEVQYITRDIHPSNAELFSNNIIKFLTNKTDFKIANDVRVIQVLPKQFIPIYLGTDENNRHLFSINFTYILEVNTQ